jgi:hypothetical protein
MDQHSLRAKLSSHYRHIRFDDRYPQRSRVANFLKLRFLPFEEQTLCKTS